MRCSMDSTEIVISYKQSKDKALQIEILAELNQCDEETIITILRDAGIDAGYVRSCKKCGREWFSKDRRGKAMCPSCREAAFADKKREYTKLYLRIRRNLEKIHELTEENKDLKKQIDALVGK